MSKIDKIMLFICFLSCIDIAAFLAFGSLIIVFLINGKIPFLLFKLCGVSFLGMLLFWSIFKAYEVNHDNVQIKGGVIVYKTIKRTHKLLDEKLMSNWAKEEYKRGSTTPALKELIKGIK